jgi:hypothetical protein
MFMTSSNLRNSSASEAGSFYRSGSRRMQGIGLDAAMRNLGQWRHIGCLIACIKPDREKSSFHRMLGHPIRRGYVAAIRKPRHFAKIAMATLFNLSASLAKEGAVAPVMAPGLRLSRSPR